jgi:hypothetical protein
VSLPDLTSEFLALHRRKREGALEPAELERWRALKEQLSQPPEKRERLEDPREWNFGEEPGAE